MSDNISIFGLGIIGSRCADNLLKAGKKVTTWNRTYKSRADETSSVTEAAASSTLLFYLKDGIACKQVFESIRASLTPQHTLINHATIDLETALWLANECESIGCEYLDCPFTGSKVAAQNAQLVYYYGGPEELLEKHKDLLELTSKEIIPVGKTGNATIIKIATNLISASTVQALSESMAIATSHGIPAQSLISAVAGNACGSVLAAMKMPTMNSGNFDTHFSLDNMLKDAKFALQLADQANLNTPGIKTTAKAMQDLCDSGSKDLDFSVLYRQFEQ